VKDFHDLKVWQQAHQLTLAVYKVTTVFPRDEAYGLTAQMRRSASSIPSNIAEGCGRTGDIELARFCQIAMGSASELEYQLLLARDLGFLNLESYQTLNEELVSIKRMLNVFIGKLRSSGNPKDE
jgi:four helix bundle protein